jgi:group I intron endonuclease
MTSGVYTITAPDGRQYVGSSRNIEKRWGQHRAQLASGVHHNPNLRNLASEFGAERLTFRIVLICIEDDLLLYEQRVIDELQPACNLRNIVGTRVARWV